MTAMAAEHRSEEKFEAWNAEVSRWTTPLAEWRYVTEQQVKLDDDPHNPPEENFRGRDQLPKRAGWRLADFAYKEEKVKKCGLLLPEVASVRLYTGPMYVKYQATLRGTLDTDGASASDTDPRMSGSRAFVTTIHAINSAVLKCSKHTKATTVYRGISNRVMPKAFHKENEHGVKGGVEVAFMSTSTERSVALGYMQQAGSDKARILLELRMGMVDRGAVRCPRPRVHLRTIPCLPSPRQLLTMPCCRCVWPDAFFILRMPSSGRRHALSVPGGGRDPFRPTDWAGGHSLRAR